ncbi:hypothetical protein APSETT444_000495 [Aspergillus pseudonomiae]
MPVQTSPPSVPDSFPSFMSVFGGRPLSIADREEQTTGIKPLDVPTNVTVNTSRRPLPFKHRESISSMTSASTDSSPTTTISTFDSPSGPETSPSSSPESPTSMPLSYTKFMPPPRNVESHSLSTAHNNLSKLSSDTPNPPVPDENSVSGSVLHELDEEDDHLDSRESTRRNERGYPNGPIQIYDSGVYLYLEPTVQEASQFDVVVNVAKEVVNPFTNTNTNNGSVMSVLRNASTNPKAVPTEVPETAMSDISFKSAFEYPPNESLPPTPRNDASKPEYIHVGWDHNSEILEDLYPLCELIDSRISQGKKVLVHCQLGASRSASLVIAYGLYKNRHLDFNSMYEIVKGRSQWVGPNMSLIYQLTDFRSRLLQGGPSKPAPEEWFAEGLRRGSEPQPSRTEAMSQPVIVTPALPASCAGLSQASTSSLSVPSTNQTTPTSAESLSFPKTPSHKRSLSPRPLTLRKSSFQVGDSAVRSIRPESLLNSWRSESGPYSLAKTDIFMRDGPAEPPALFSPRTTGFLAAPMSQSISSQLENNGLHGFRFGSRIADPRSPPPGNERLIMRNIDEFL